MKIPASRSKAAAEPAVKTSRGGRSKPTRQPPQAAEQSRGRRKAEDTSSVDAAARSAGPSFTATTDANGVTIGKRAAKAAGRRAAIVDAGLQEFVTRGYAATRLEDVAKRAGVAKGTIYLHFKDKEALFQELIRSALVPVANLVVDPPASGVSARALLENFAETFLRDVAGTPRADIVRLIISEGSRFPSLAEFHHREVVSRAVAGITQLIQYGVARGEIRNAALAQFPQIVVAPALVAVLWQGLFGRYAPLDTAAMLRVHLDLIFGEEKTE
jgi:AcrR family transcriptional regulator